MARVLSLVMAVGFICIAFLGLVLPAFLGMHLTMAHTMIHLVSAMAALYFGLVGTAASARRFCLFFGLLYLALGVAGYLFGSPGVSLVGSFEPMSDRYLWRIVPNTLELGGRDHAANIFFGFVFLLGALIPVAERPPQPRVTWNTQRPRPHAR